MNKAIKTCSFIMPGEFEKQKSVWIVWPHNKKDWPGYFNSIPGTCLLYTSPSPRDS